MESLLEHGVLQAPIGRLVDENDKVHAPFQRQVAVEKWLSKHEDRHVELAAGHRRVWSVQELSEAGRGRFDGNESIEITLKDLSDEELAAVFHQENAERDNVSPVVEAEQWANMIADGMTQSEVADLSGVSGGTVSKRIRLMNFPERVRVEIEDEDSDLTLAAAMEIAHLWNLSAEEEEALVEMLGGVRGVQEHLLDVARKKTVEKVREAVKEGVKTPIQQYQSGHPAPSGDGAPDSEGQDDAATRQSTPRNGARSEADHRGPEEDQTNAKEEAEKPLQIEVRGDLKPGRYVLEAPSEEEDSQPVEDEEAVRAARMIASQMVGFDGSDWVRLIACALGSKQDRHAAKCALLMESVRKSDDWRSTLQSIVEGFGIDLMHDPLQ